MPCRLSRKQSGCAGLSEGLQVISGTWHSNCLSNRTYGSDLLSIRGAALRRSPSRHRCFGIGHPGRGVCGENAGLATLGIGGRIGVSRRAKSMNVNAHRHRGSSVTGLCPGHARSLSNRLRKPFWLLMLAAHAPALLGAWRSVMATGLDAERLGGCLILTLSMLFFALKARDIPLLRLRTGRRSFVVACIVAALLHVNVLQPQGDSATVPQCTALVATTWLIVQLPLVRRAFGSLGSRVAAAHRRSFQITFCRNTVWLDMFRPHCWVLAFRFFCLRAPPA